MTLKNILPRALLVVSIVSATLITKTATANESPREYLFGIVPQQAASQLAKVWIPFINRIAMETKLPIRFATTKDIPTFEGCLSRKAYDFAYMNPYHYTVFSKKSGYQAFAHQAGKQIQGLIVVRTDSTVRTLADLNNMTLAFPSPAAFAATVLPRAELLANGIQHEPKYVKSHDSVYRAVEVGLLPAGGGIDRTLNNKPEALRQQLRVIYRTKKYTPHAFASLPDVTDGARQNILNAMIKIGKEAPDVLAALGIKQFSAARDSDWDDVRNLKVGKDQATISVKGDGKCRFD